MDQFRPGVKFFPIALDRMMAEEPQFVGRRPADVAGLTTATLLGASALKGSVVSSAGAMLNNNSSLSVEIRQLTSLSSASVRNGGCTLNTAS